MSLNLFVRIRQRLIRDWALRRLRRFLDNVPCEVSFLGSSTGGWTVPSSLLRPGATAVCVGVGEDMSFDVELNKRGLNVYALDPTPRSKAHVMSLLDAAANHRSFRINGSRANYELAKFCSDRFRYLEIGLWEKDTSIRFYSPQHRSHVSHSIVNLHRTDSYFEADCLSLRSVQKLLGIQTIDLLKLDVEGAEYAILSDILEQGPHPRVLCFEFDELRTPLDGHYMDRILTAIRELKDNGYRLAHIESSNTMWIDCES